MRILLLLDTRAEWTVMRKVVSAAQDCVLLCSLRHPGWRTSHICSHVVLTNAKTLHGHSARGQLHVAGSSSGSENHKPTALPPQPFLQDDESHGQDHPQNRIKGARVIASVPATLRSLAETLDSAI